MRSWSLSQFSLPLLLLLLLLSTNCVLAQIGFSSVPTTVNDGQSVQVSFSGWDGSSPISLVLVQNGAVVDDDILDDDDAVAASTITWQVELDDDNVGGVYNLQVSSGGSTAISNPINIIDQNGVGAPASSAAPPATTNPTAAPSTTAGGAAASATSAVASGGSNTNTNTNTNTAGGGSSPSASPTGAVALASASIAATASTLLTSVILGQSVTITPSSAASGSSNSNSTGSAGASAGSGSSTNLAAGAIAGIVIGVLVLIVALLVFGWWYRRRRSRNNTQGRSRKSFFGPTEKTEMNGTPRDGSYLQPSYLAAGAAGAARGGQGTHEPSSPGARDGVASELHSTPTARTTSEMDSNSFFPAGTASSATRSIPSNTYEMPASFPQSHEMGTSSPVQEHPRGGIGAGLNDASASAHNATATGGLPGSTGTNNNVTKSPSDSSEQNNFKSPVSEMSDDTGTGTVNSQGSMGGLVSPRISGGNGGSISRKAVGGGR